MTSELNLVTAKGRRSPMACSPGWRCSFGGSSSRWSLRRFAERKAGSLTRQHGPVPPDSELRPIRRAGRPRRSCRPAERRPRRTGPRRQRSPRLYPAPRSRGMPRRSRFSRARPYCFPRGSSRSITPSVYNTTTSPLCRDARPCVQRATGLGPRMRPPCSSGRTVVPC